LDGTTTDRYTWQATSTVSAQSESAHDGPHQRRKRSQFSCRIWRESTTSIWVASIEWIKILQTIASEWDPQNGGGWPVFVFCVETGIHNAWQIYRKTEQGREDPFDLLEFRRSIVKTYLVKYADKPKNAGRPKNGKPIDKRVPNVVRYDGLHHWCIPAPKQKRCAYCHKNTTKMCEKCPNVNLHDGLCFKEYHTLCAKLIWKLSIQPVRFELWICDRKYRTRSLKLVDFLLSIQ